MRKKRKRRHKPPNTTAESPKAAGHVINISHEALAVAGFSLLQSMLRPPRDTAAAATLALNRTPIFDHKIHTAREVG
jgi:hypothetical protein